MLAARHDDDDDDDDDARLEHSYYEKRVAWDMAYNEAGRPTKKILTIFLIEETSTIFITEEHTRKNSP